MTDLTLRSASRATDAGWLAAADIATFARELGAEYRLVGGLAITLLVHAFGAEAVAPERETADADLGVPFDVCADERLVATLNAAGYRRVGGNRFRREVGDRELVIDVLSPSYEGRLVPNQKHGALYVDEIPGLRTALNLPSTKVDVTAVLSDGTDLAMSLRLPSLPSALTLKAHAYQGRLLPRDALDIHRLLATAHHAGMTAADWPDRIETREAARILHAVFASARPNPHLRSSAALVRLLTRQIVPAPA
jgi:hypothetical protein